MGQKNDSSPSKDRFLGWAVKDPIDIAKATDRQDLEALLVAGIGIVGISAFDYRSSDYFRSTFGNNDFLGVVNELGNLNYVAPFSAALFGTSLLTDNHKFQDAAFTSLQSVLYTKITVTIAKYAFARDRPEQNTDPYVFNFFERNATSFPSGHASNAFALVVPWVVYYPNVLTYSMLALPVGTALARVSKGRHWISDVSAGALIGAYWGYKLSRRHLNLAGAGNFHAVPIIHENGGGISLTFSF
ncbi:phosphatase PAP2 family protein [Rhodohalobacter mucosus]|nr:phosphatase PAP2 family protein [Rhodohalobacter mucosus]